MFPTITQWLSQKKWTMFPFQQRCMELYALGHNVLLHSSTGSGKTYAVWLPILNSLMKGKSTGNTRVIWLTPLRALTSDTETSLKAPVTEMGLHLSIASRTGDTSAAEKKKLKDHRPDVLITTPESLSLLLADPHCEEHFKHLECVVVDEWHELLSGKRGVQAELCLARLRKFSPRLLTWGLSATIGNVEEALLALTGVNASRESTIVVGETEKRVVLDTLIPEEMERYPWAGHLGIRLVEQVAAEIDQNNTSLVFTNTRAQSEIWYQSLLEARPQWAGVMALHHGSLDKELRGFVEQGLKAGQLKVVVATSGLDLGVDFSPVERVLQIGSPKGVARILQRAGRSGHSPGQTSRITFVPTHAFELVEFAGVKAAIAANHMESRMPLDAPLDVLSQHLITVGIGGGFAPQEMYEEVRSAYSYRNLTPAQWEWALKFTVTGGDALAAYPEYARLHLHEGKYYITHKRLARQHLMNIGTITSEVAVKIKLANGRTLGSVEEYFVSRLKPGDGFVFSGRVLEFVRMKNNEAEVKYSANPKAIVPSWEGGRMPLSTQLSQAVRNELEKALNGQYEGEEMLALQPILDIQLQKSTLPAKDELLIEVYESKEGYHCLFYPFEGRLVHEGLMSLFAWRISQLTPLSFSMACNDYGFELLSNEPIPLMEALEEGLLESENLDEHILESMNASEMARRQFRDIARVAGLIFSGFPGQKQNSRNIMANSGLLYDVFVKFDPQNLLLQQAQREVLERQLELSRIKTTLRRMSASNLLIKELESPGPLGFPLMVDRLRDKLTSEQLRDRISKMQAVL
jgi:ATP-dependent Lhr-like helicase